jgi:hypothetical protein
MSEETEEINTNENGFLIELGDIIHIIASSNPNIHEQNFYVNYVDSKKLECINIETSDLVQLNMNEENMFTDESITEIQLLSRSEEKGYTRQHRLLHKQWIDVHFNGDVPCIATGQITNLEEDMIEVTTFPDSNVFYIDFEYKGIPQDIPIEKIVLREPPNKAVDLEEGEIYQSPASTDEASIVYTETGESIITIPDGVVADENIRNTLHNIYLDANELFGEDLGEIFQRVEVSESQKRFTVDVQLVSLTDELLSTVPNNKRTEVLMQKINRIVQRFKELRELFSTFDKNGNVIGKKKYGEMYKPIIEHILSLDTKFRWLIPVVSNKKYLYSDNTFDNNNTDAIINESSNELILALDQSMKDYHDETIAGDVSKYEKLYSDWNRQSVLFEPPTNEEEFLSFNQEIKTDLECIVNNYDNYKSTVITNGVNNSVSFFIQKYNMGMKQIKSYEMKNGKKCAVRKELTPNESVSIHSFLFMPDPIIHYSQVDLPGTNILIRSQLSQQSLDYFRILKKNKKINQHVVVEDQLDKELYQHQIHKQKELTSGSFISDILEERLDDSLNEELNKESKFLNTIIPNTRYLIHIFKKYVHGNLSMVDFIQTLEPFLIYSDHITYSQYKDIRFLINEKRTEYKSQTATNSRLFQEIKLHLEKLSPFHINKILALLDEDTKVKNMFLEEYGIDPIKKNTQQTEKTSSEVLYNLILNDNNKLFTTLITYMLISLITPNELLDSLEKPMIEDMSHMGNGYKDCIRRYLAKKYSSIEELKKDNIGGIDIYFDSDYDDTPYDILKKYKEDQKKMSASEFITFLAENLVQKHNCPRNQSVEMANTLILGKKKVVDGVYAIVKYEPSLSKELDEEKLSVSEKKEIEMEKDIKTYYHYYVRKQDHWVHDNSIQDETFMDTNTLFCNMDFKCYKNSTSKTCDSVDSAEMRLKNRITKQAIQEFDKRYSTSVTQLKELLENNILNYSTHLKHNKVLKTLFLYKQNEINYRIGNTVENVTTITSPYAKLRDLILAQDDFSKKQRDICRLYQEFCRDPLSSEDSHWAYCIETSTKLLPFSFYILAEAYTTDSNYSDKLNEVCAKYGQISEDGDSIVDKYSGYVLRKIDFINEDTYDESGFKIITDSVIEKDLATLSSELLTKQKIDKKVFQSENSEVIYKIFYALCTHLDIPAESIEEDVIRVSSELIDSKMILTEPQYKKKAEKAEKEKGKSSPPYDIYKNQIIITCIGSVLLTAIQTSIPSFKVRKTFPGCVQSYKGYPMESKENTSGLKYIACVLYKLKSSISPWDSIHKFTASTIENRMIEIVENFVIKHADIKNWIENKKEYSIKNPTETIPEEHQISKWKHFLPPVVEFSVEKTIHGIANDFDEETISLIEHGHKDQRTHIDMYRSKTLLNSYGVIECINKIVSKQNVLLKSIDKIPFLENACCNELEKSTHPMTYFINEDKTIDLFIKRSIKNEIILKNIYNWSRANLLFNDEKTRFDYPIIPHNIFEQNVYKAFIHYCNFDNDVPIPNDLLVVCREKFDLYNKNASIEEKMDFFKKNGKTLTEHHLIQLMSIVNARNTVEIEPPSEVLPIAMFNDFIKNQIDIDKKPSLLNEKRSLYKLCKLLSNLISVYKPNQMISEHTGNEDEEPINPKFNDATDELTDYLEEINTSMHKEIIKYIREYGQLSTAQFKGYVSYMADIMKWEMDRSVKETGFEYDEGFYRITQFIKNSIQNMSRIYPHIILNDVLNTKVHKHWGLSENHLKDIKKELESFTELNPFKENPQISEYLRKIQNEFSDIHLFIHHIPVNTPISRKGVIYNSLFSKETVYSLYQYCWYLTIYRFMQMSDNSFLLNLEKERSRKIRKAMIDESKEEITYIMAEASSTNDEIQEYEEDRELYIDVLEGTQKELKETVCSLLLVYLNLQNKDKKILDKSYSNITKINKKTKKNEKDEITSFLEKKNKGDRKIEHELKKLKLGRWNIGMQSGLFKYDKNAYDRDREANMSRLFDEMQNAEGFDINMEMRTIQDLEGENAMNQFDDNEGNDITGLDEDYTDGHYYPEDGDYEE